MPILLLRPRDPLRVMSVAVLLAAMSLVSHTPAKAGVAEIITAFDRGQHARAVAEIRPLAEGGDARAQYVYAAMIESEKVKVPGATSVEWYKRSAEQGYAKAKYAYARMIISDLPGQEKVPARVMTWLEEAATEGVLPAGHLLGSVLLSEAESALELRRVVNVYTKMAESGDTDAMVKLGEILSARTVERRDLEDAGFHDTDKAAFSWFQRAATELNPSARVWVARAYEKGEGVARNKSAALEWYMIAAKHDDPAAQYKLSSLYQLGDGVEQNQQAAFGWALRAAEQGLGPAMLATGLRYAYGSGVAKDTPKGYFWLSLAQRNDQKEAARFLHTISTQLSAKKIKALNKQILAWKPRDGEAVRLEIERMQARSIDAD